MSLQQLEAELQLSRQQINELRRALRDTQTRKPKTPVQHEQDQSWLDWALAAAKKYGPQLLALLEL